MYDVCNASHCKCIHCNYVWSKLLHSTVYRSNMDTWYQLSWIFKSSGMLNHNTKVHFIPEDLNLRSTSVVSWYVTNRIRKLTEVQHIFCLKSLGDEWVHHNIVHFLRLERLGVGSTDVTSCRVCTVCSRYSICKTNHCAFAQKIWEDSKHSFCSFLFSLIRPEINKPLFYCYVILQ